MSDSDEKKPLSERLYYHWTSMILMTWGAVSLIVIPVTAIWLKEANPTNYDTYIIIGMSIFTLTVWLYNYILDESVSSQSYSKGLKKIFDNKDLSSEELSKRTDMYRKMFKK